MIIIAINERLQSSTGLEAIVGEKIYPLSISQNDKAPAITFNAGDIPNQSKSGDTTTTHECYVITLAKSLTQLADINKLVKDLFHHKVWVTPEFKYIRGKVESINRDYNSEYQEHSGTIRITLISKTI
jgi:hypothetical protein